MGAKLYQVWLKQIYKKHNIYVGTPLDIKDDILVYLTSFKPKRFTSARIIDKVIGEAAVMDIVNNSFSVVNMNGVILIFTTLKNTIYLFLLNLSSILLIIEN